MTVQTRQPASSLFGTAEIEMCDRCGMRARVRVVLDGGELYFCRRHAGAYRDTWQQRMYLVKDLPL